MENCENSNDISDEGNGTVLMRKEMTKEKAIEERNEEMAGLENIRLLRAMVTKSVIA